MDPGLVVGLLNIFLCFKVYYRNNRSTVFKTFLDDKVCENIIVCSNHSNREHPTIKRKPSGISELKNLL